MDGQFCEGTRTFGGQKKKEFIWLVTGKQWKKKNVKCQDPTVETIDFLFNKRRRNYITITHYYSVKYY